MATSSNFLTRLIFTMFSMFLNERNTLMMQQLQGSFQIIVLILLMQGSKRLLES